MHSSQNPWVLPGTQFKHGLFSHHRSWFQGVVRRSGSCFRTSRWVPWNVNCQFKGQQEPQFGRWWRRKVHSVWTAPQPSVSCGANPSSRSSSTVLCSSVPGSSILLQQDRFSVPMPWETQSSVFIFSGKCTLGNFQWRRNKAILLNMFSSLLGIFSFQNFLIWK